MIRKIVFVCTLMMAIAVAATAQSRGVDQLLAPSKRMLSDKSCWAASFRSSLFDASGRTLEQQSGRMYLQGSSFRLEYGSIVAVFSDKKLTHYNKEEHTLTSSQPDAEELVQLNPLYFLRSYAERYRAKALPESKRGPIIGFTPIKKGGVKSIELQLERGSLVPREVSVLSSDGYRLVINIDDLKETAPREGSFFVLKASQYPGVEVVDLD